MKKIVAILSFTVFGMTLFGQADVSGVYGESATYVIFTSNPDSLATEGITRSLYAVDFLRELGHPDVLIDPVVVFSFGSQSKEYWISFMHMELDSLSLSEIGAIYPDDNPEVIKKPIDFLGSVELIDMDNLLPTMSRQDVWAFKESLRGKKVYFIDRREITDSMVTLIEVCESDSNKPIDFVADDGMDVPDEDGIYVMFTSNNDSLAPERVCRRILSEYPPDESRHADGSIGIGIEFSFESRSKGYRISFSHSKYDTTAPTPDRPAQLPDKHEVFVKPTVFLSSVGIIDMDALMPTMSREDAWTFHRSLKGKGVYFIDRNDIADSTVKLIEVKTDGTNKPTNDAYDERG